MGFLGSYLGKYEDSFWSMFRTQQGLIRQARSKIRQETGENKDELAFYKKYVQDIKQMKAEQLNKDVAKGYFTLKEKEIDNAFDALHAILRVFIKIMDELKDIQKRIESDTKDEERKKLLKELNECWRITAAGLDNALSSVAGRASLTLMGNKLLEFESNVRDIQFHIQQLRPVDRGWKSALKRLKRDISIFRNDKADEKAIKMTDADIQATETNLKYIIGGLAKEVNEVTQLMERIHNDFKETCDSESRGLDTGGKGRLGRVSEAKPPSFEVLAKPVAEGGFGYPRDKEDALIAEEKRIDVHYEKRFNDLLGEIRQLMSIPPHNMTKAA